MGTPRDDVRRFPAGEAGVVSTPAPRPRPLQLTWRIVIKEVMGTARLPLLKVMSESFLGSHSVRDWNSLASPWTKTGFESPGSGLSSTRPARALVFCVPRSALSPSTGSASSPIK